METAITIPATVADVAEAVGRKLQTCGWAQGGYFNSQGICLEGAFLQVASELTGVTVRSLLEVTAEYENQFSGSSLGQFWFNLLGVVHEECPSLAPYEFNDLDSTTLEDVLLMVKKAGAQ